MMYQTYQEIRKTAEALDQTVNKMDSVLPMLKDLTHEHCIQKMVFIGCGSGYCLSKSMAAMCESALGVCATAAAGGDVLLHLNSYKKIIEGSWLVIVSRSGETSEISLMLDALKNDGVSFFVLGIYGAEGTSLSRKSDFVIELPWAFDKSICQTKNIACFYLAGTYMLAALAEDTATMDSLRRAVKCEAGFMDRAEAAMKLVADKPFQHVVVMGDAEICGAAEEGALAFNEIAQIDSNYYHLLDSRHGPFVRFNENTVVIAAVSNVCNEREIALIRDVVKTGAITITCSGLPCSIEGAMNLCIGEDLSYQTLALPLLSICQMLSYYKALVEGVNPDSPDGLSACVIFKES